MARFKVAAALLVLSCAFAGCDDDSNSNANGSSDADQSGDGSGENSSGTTDGGMESSGDSDRSASDLLEQPPDPEANDAEPPDASWMLLRAFAVAEAGASGGEFIGFDPIWFTDMNPGGESIQDLPGWEEEFDTVAGCSILQTADGSIIAQASFHHRTERNLRSSFSMSDNGDGTVVWGLYDAGTEEEWSATGPGSASIKYARLEDPLGGWPSPRISRRWEPEVAGPAFFMPPSRADVPVARTSAVRPGRRRRVRSSSCSAVPGARSAIAALEPPSR